MRLRLLAIGTKMPRWVDEGFEDYAARMPRECRLELRALPLGGRGKQADPARAVVEQGSRLLAATGDSFRVCLDRRGAAVDSPALAQRLAGWMQGGRDVALLVGGPDGLSPECLHAAQWRWSLSPLTLPHGLVRVLVAEQLYRAWTLLAGHPYHRG